jgi:dihydrofolate reductase
MQQNRHLKLFIAMSLDGYIAQHNDDLSFLSLVEKAGEDYGYADFIANIDTVLIGRKTYDWVMKHTDVFPHTDKTTYVITRTAKPTAGNTIFYTDSLVNLVQDLKSRPGKHIYCDGGAELVNELLNHNLLDEIIISVIPILLGNGIRLFNEGRPEQPLRLCSVKTFDSGLTQLHYNRLP